VLLYVDQLKLTPKYTDIYEYPPLLCLYIGLFQMLALIPGVSRSGATIVGSLLLGTDKRSAPPSSPSSSPCRSWPAPSATISTRAATSSPRNSGSRSPSASPRRFITAFFVVRYLLDYVSRHGFAVFAYWRIFVGAIGLWGVLLFK
jgi:undecaprenyl-diphosphatase